MDLRDYWLAVTTGWKLILGAVLVAIVGGAVLAATATPEYQSSTRFFVVSQVEGGDVDELSQRNVIAASRVASYVEVATGSFLVDRVSQKLDYKVNEALITAKNIPGTVLMEVSVTDQVPERARDIAAAYGELLPGAIDELEQGREVQGAQVQLQVIDEAELPNESVAPSPVRSWILALLLGLGVGALMAVVRYVVAQSGRARSAATGGSS